MQSTRASLQPWMVLMSKAEISTRRWRKLRERILARDGHMCQACGSQEELQIDHIISRVDGGQNNESNLQVLCKLCNLRKGKKSGFLSVKGQATPPFFSCLYLPK
jgi:hypothetical protein